jgi:hypothetical protein
VIDADYGNSGDLPGQTGATIRACRGPDNNYTISAKAGVNFIAELSQQVAWLAATLRSSPLGDGVAAVYPCVENLVVGTSPDANAVIQTVATCTFSFAYDVTATVDTEDSGFCWASMFHNPVLVTGFPILRRSLPRLGLELSLGAMVFLMRTDETIECNGRIVIKGFDRLLVTTAISNGFVSWHLLINNSSEERISYFDSRIEAVSTGKGQTGSLNILKSSRHVIGWCNKVTDFCGKYRELIAETAANTSKDTLQLTSTSKHPDSPHHHLPRSSSARTSKQACT